MPVSWKRFFRRNTAWVLLAVAVIVILLLVFRGVDLSPYLDGARNNAAVIATLIALASLLVVMVTSWKNWGAARKQATIDAWSSWSDATKDDREKLTRRLGSAVISESQAQGLADDKLPLTDRDGNTMSAADREDLLLAVIHILNGLERIAVGAEMGVYQAPVLEKLGGTTIKRSYERLEPYILYRRSFPDPMRRQKKVFVTLERLARNISANEVDAARLQSLRRQT